MGDTEQLIPLDLLLKGNAAATELQVSMAASTGPQALTVPIPPQLEQAYRAWRNRFIPHHGGGAIPADALRHYATVLESLLGEWFRQPAWQPLLQALEQSPGHPLRLRFEGTESWLERLPWEALSRPWQRPIWRLANTRAFSSRRPSVPRGARQPRVLLLVGEESNLSLDEEAGRLVSLQQRGRIALTLLRGAACTLEALRTALADPAGWDSLIFLGHSQADAASGGRLQLGDGSWLSARTLENDLQQAAEHGLDLVLLSSCSGLDLARSAIAAGCYWAVCFREPVPCTAASRAFCSLLLNLEDGHGLVAALDQARHDLKQNGPLSSDLLLSLVAAPTATPFTLPLRRRHQLWLRLTQSQPRQAIVAGACLSLAALTALVPWNPASTYLLDRRLAVQRIWRSLTDQPGPQKEPLAVLLLDPRRTGSEYGAPPTPGMVPRKALVEILRRTPADQVPRVGLDVVLDQPAANDAELAAVLREQRRKLVVSGWFGADSAVTTPGRRTQELPPELRSSGLQPRRLDVNTPGNSKPAEPQPVPLRLQEALNAEHFAGALSNHPAPFLPAEAVIDWSLRWDQLIRPVMPSELSALRTPTLLVGTTGTVDPDHPDLFLAPGAASEPLAALSGGSSREVPGVLVQAALAQSLTHRLWLQPLPVLPITALASGAGVLLAAGLADRRRRLAVVLAIGIVAVPLSLQLAVSHRLLVPLLLPLGALTATALLRNP